MFELLFKKTQSPQLQVRIALTKIINARKLYSFPLLATTIGVDRDTLVRFLKDEKDVEFMTLIKIVNYIEGNDEHNKE